MSYDKHADLKLLNLLLHTHKGIIWIKRIWYLLFDWSMPAERQYCSSCG